MYHWCKISHSKEYTLKIVFLTNSTSNSSFFDILSKSGIGEILQTSVENFRENQQDFRHASVLLLEGEVTFIQHFLSTPLTNPLPYPFVAVISNPKDIQISDYEAISTNTSIRNVEIVFATDSITEIQFRIAKSIREYKSLQFRNEVIILKDQVLAIIAHDLKNVFVGLQGLSKNLTLMTEGLDEDTIEYFSLLESGIDQGYLLLINLLEWSKLQSGQSVLKFKQSSLKEIIDQNVSLLYPMSFKKSQDVISEIDDSIQVFCDTNMVSSVIRNIMNNAMKFTPEYGKITITAENKPSENSVTISISDTGIGIAEDQIKKLFFTDSTETTAGTSGELGTGLGLLLCKDLIQRNGGTFWVKSSLGQGTSFFFTVPINSSK